MFKGTSEGFEKLALLVVLAILAPQAFAAGQEDIARWDPAMAQKNAVVTNGIKWIDGMYLPIEGRAFNDTAQYYDRLPANVTTNVNGGVRFMKHQTSGMMFRFRTDSKKLVFKWSPYNECLSMDHMPSTGVSGIDVYRFDEKTGIWRYATTGRIWDAKKGGSLSMRWTPGEACIVNLPLYNGLKSFKLGIESTAKVEALGPRKSGIGKPVVFYGTSITHGGCCSRPGLAFVNWVGRDLDVPVVGLGFSGSGKMEFEMSEHLVRIDASCYVLDCLWNMDLPLMKTNYEPFIRNLRAKRPGVPIVMAEHCNVYGNAKDEKDAYIRKLYEKLVSEGWANLVYLPNDEMYAGDYEGTVDGVHPNDLGMQSMKNAFGKAVRAALAAASGHCAEADSFGFATWNIGHFSLGRGPVSTIAPADAKTRATAYLSFLRSARVDVLGLSEFSPQFTSDGAVTAAQTALSDFPDSVVGPLNGYHVNAVFWRGAKLVGSGTKAFPAANSPAYYQWARLHVLGREVCFVATHCDWRTTESKGHELDRIEQLLLLARTFKDEPRVVIAGDFNTCFRRMAEEPWRDAPEDFTVFRSAGFDAAHWGELKTNPACAPRLSVDNVFTKGFDISEVRVVPDPALSDHALLRCTLRFRD